VGSNFYGSSLYEALTPAWLAAGLNVLWVNTRGHDLAYGAALRLGRRWMGAAMADEAALHGIPLAEAQSRARGFALEIASDYSYGVVRALELFLTWLWTRLYDGIELHNFATVTHIAPGHEIVYVPCHRSHIDYLLLSYIIHRQGLTPPHIAAGANLNLPIVGSLLRRGGAFFLRRSLKGEALYAAVFHEYLHLMLARGFSIEYFIEGGRSRSGRMLTPKAGILGMTVLSFIRQHARPLVFVPVYVGYEKIIEGKAYLGELAGQPKQRESLLKRVSWNLLARLGEGVFDSSQAAGAFIILLTQTNASAQANFLLRGIDASLPKTAQEKAEVLRTGQVVSVSQKGQLENPDARIALDEAVSSSLLSDYAEGLVGLQTSDDPMFITGFWELAQIDRAIWDPLQGTPEELTEFAGASWLVRWESGNGLLMTV